MTEQTETITAEAAATEIEAAPEKKQTEASPEDRARKLGWKPKEEFKGPAEKWRSADDFIEYGEKLNPVLKDNLHRIEKELEKAQRQIAEKDEAIKGISDYHGRIEAQARKDALEMLKAQRKQAMKDQDADAFEQADDAIRKLDKEPAPKPQAPKPPDPVVVKWQEDNAWYGKDKMLTLEFNRTAADLRNMGERAVGTEFADSVTEILKEKYPDKFRTPRQSPQTVEGSRPNGGGSGKKAGFDALPDEAQKAFKTFVKQKVFKDSPEERAKYAKYYTNPNAEIQQ